MRNQVRLPSARSLVSTANLYLITIILVAMVLVGTLSDYSISLSLFDPSSTMAVFFAGYGEYPVFMAMSASGTLFIMGRSLEKPLIGYLQVGGGTGLLIVAVGGGTVIPEEYIGLSLVVRGAIALVVVGVSAYLAYLAARSAPRELMIRVAAVLVVVVFLEIFIVTALKLLWERPRMRMIIVEDGAWFMPWYNPGFPQKEGLMSIGVASEEFKSFPSGHTANSAVLMTLTAFSVLNTRLRDRASLLLWIGFVWALIVAYSRIVAGAHFLTDVAAGLAITFFAMVATYQIAFPPQLSGEAGGPRHARPS